jgi:hypothetical protein
VCQHDFAVPLARREINGFGQINGLGQPGIMREVEENGVIAVLVIYERDLQEAKAWPQLCAMLTSGAGGGLKLRHVLVYDNSTRSQPEPPSSSWCSYVHDPKNGGTAAAYARGARLAHELGLGWLLLLDHDTLLPGDFMERASAAVLAASERPGALLPWVVHGQRTISPAKITWTGSVRPLSVQRGKSFPFPLSGIASASLVDSAALQALGPLPTALWLDYVDHWIFTQLSELGRKVVLFDAIVQHDLSICDPSGISRARLHSILDGEALFIRSQPWIARAIYPLRIALRLVRSCRSHPRGALDLLAWIFGRRKARE